MCKTHYLKPTFEVESSKADSTALCWSNNTRIGGKNEGEPHKAISEGAQRFGNTTIRNILLRKKTVLIFSRKKDWQSWDLRAETMSQIGKKNEKELQ